MTQMGMLDWVTTLSITQGGSLSPCMPTPTLTFHLISTPSTSTTTLSFILPVHSNRISYSRQLRLQSITMVRSRHTRTPKWVPRSTPQSITRRLGPRIPLLHLHRNRCMTASICISAVRTPKCCTSGQCRITLAIGSPTCPPQCTLNTCTVPPTKPCSMPSQVPLLHQLRISPLLLSPCSMSIRLMSFTPNTPVHTHMV